MNIRLNLRSLPYPPFLVAIFIGVSIYAPNREYFPLGVMIPPICALVSLIGVVLMVLKRSKFDMNKNLILISGALLLNFTYYPVYDLLSWKWQIISPATLIYIILWAILIAVTWKATSSQAKDVAQILGIVTVCLVIISSANFLFFIVSDANETSDSGQAFETQFQRYLAEDLIAPINTRDFYFIILDRYPGEEIFFANNNFNNSDFSMNLTSMGFIVLKTSKSNYGYTAKSIPSMLNMDYIHSLDGTKYNEEYNRLWRFFKSQGFTFVFLPSNWLTTTKNDYADIVLNQYPIPLDRESQLRVFQEIMFFERTLLGKTYYSIMHFLFNKTVPPVSIDALQNRIQAAAMSGKDKFNEQFKAGQYINISRTHVPRTFENISKIPQIPGKKFVIAHINHWEYLDKPTNNSIINVNQIVEGLVKELIEQSNPTPIIVILSDHGAKPSIDALKANTSIYAKYACYPNGNLSNADILASWYPVNNFEAFYLPDGGDEIIYHGMTPVNVWRTILNYYFKTDFSHLDDRSYWWYSPTNSLYEVGIDASVSQEYAVEPV